LNKDSFFGIPYSKHHWYTIIFWLITHTHLTWTLIIWALKCPYKYISIVVQPLSIAKDSTPSLHDGFLPHTQHVGFWQLLMIYNIQIKFCLTFNWQDSTIFTNTNRFNSYYNNFLVKTYIVSKNLRRKEFAFS